jgi:hypothetical protein
LIDKKRTGRATGGDAKRSYVFFLGRLLTQMMRIFEIHAGFCNL